MYLIRHLGDVPCAFGRSLADVGDEDVENLRTDSGGQFTRNSFATTCERNLICREFTNTNAPAVNGIIERVIAIADTMQKAARIQGSIACAASGIPNYT